jgi:SNF2 family DNA or RNA helicase
VVLPTSLIFNWKRRGRTLRPGSQGARLHGAERAERFAKIAEHDVVLTTYPLLWRDRGVLVAQNYHC